MSSLVDTEGTKQDHVEKEADTFPYQNTEFLEPGLQDDASYRVYK